MSQIYYRSIANKQNYKIKPQEVFQQLGLGGSFFLDTKIEGIGQLLMLLDYTMKRLGVLPDTHRVKDVKT